MGNVLVDDPEAFVVNGENERVADLSQGLERAEGGSQLAGWFGLVGELWRATIVGQDLLRAH